MFAAPNLLLTGQAILPVTLQGTVNASQVATVTIPTHAVGQIIVICARTNTGTVAPPAASGTVPAWVLIDNGASRMNTYYFVATATNHTSGTWANTAGMVATVLSDQGGTPIGGHAQSTSTETGGVTAPAVTMTHTDGTSYLLHYFTTASGGVVWSAAPTGYTLQASNALVCCDSKNVTTTDGSVFTTNNVGTSKATDAASLEIRAY